MRLGGLAVLVLGALLVLFGVGGWPVDARPLAYRAEFAVGDREYVEMERFTSAVNAACAKGDLAGLAQRLAPEYLLALRQQVELVDRRLTVGTLREMRALLPPLRANAFVLGRAKGDRIALVLEEQGLGYRVAETGAVCLTCVRVRWDGRRFLLGQPVLFHSGQGEIPDAANRLVEDWLSRGAAGMNGAPIRKRS